LNFVGVFAELVVALACIFAADILASRLFSDRPRIQLANVARADLLVVGIALVGVSTVASAVPTLVQFVGRAIWFAQGTLQSQFLPSTERSWEPLSREVLSFLIGVVLVTRAGRLGAMLDRGGSKRNVEQAG
jgi:uncharacterized membrane protein YoaT (DUF817 family)